jgi:hypothetical protein
MDEGPRLQHLTRLEQQDKPRFELEWVLPLEPGLPTHVTLYDLQLFPPAAVAGGHGGDEAEALLDLWRGLAGRPEVVDAIPVVAEAYARRTGRPPTRRTRARRIGPEDRPSSMRRS